MTQHTPGPWKLGDDALIEDAEGMPFAGAFWDDEDIPQEVSIANARLMAAAPDLLEALKDMIGRCTGADTYFPEAVAAIAKAEGRT
jgi:hypothetical protein